MPPSGETPTQSTDTDWLFRAYFEDDLKAAIKQRGFTATLKLLKKRRLPTHGMMTVHEGVVEELPFGLYEAALQTEEGRLVLRGAERTDRESPDPQLVSSHTPSYDSATDSRVNTADQLLHQLADAEASPSASLICAIEVTRFDPSQQEVLLPLLWQYILDHRNSNDRDELVAVGAAIRKYIALMPMDRMGELAVLLQSGHRSPVPIDLEIEVAKMIYRNFEVHPPVVADPHPELAQQLYEMVKAYTNPRILLRDKHSAAASMAIEAIVSMRSPLAEQAWHTAAECPYRWFAELVDDDLEELHEKWSSKNPDVSAWLSELRNSVLAYR